MAETSSSRRARFRVDAVRAAPAVNAYLALVSRLVQRSLRTATCFGLLAEISGLAVWLAVDRGDNATARRRYREAIKRAERAHHPLLVSYMTTRLGFFAVEAGHPRAGIAMIDRAASQLDREAPDAARAWLASLHAVAHAALGDETARLTALRAAEKYLKRQGGEPRWPWVFPFDGAKAARYQAGALSRLGDVRAATAAFDAARPALASPKARALAQLHQARVLASVVCSAKPVTWRSPLSMSAASTAASGSHQRCATSARHCRKPWKPGISTTR